MAPYLLVSSTRLLIALATLDPHEAAPLSDAAITSYHAVKRSLHLLGTGSTAMVIGAGGLGQMAIQILRALSSATTIVAVDVTADKLVTARRVGAEEALLSGDEAVKRINDMTRGQGAQFLLDIVGVTSTLSGVDPKLLQGLARCIPAARLHVVRGGGHLVLLDRPAETADLVTQFIE